MLNHSEDRVLYLSYALEDLSTAIDLAVSLKFAGLPLWIDRLDCRPNGGHEERIEDALQNASGLLVLLSSHYLAASYCLSELTAAQERGIPIFPVLLEEVNLSVFLPDLETPSFQRLINYRSSAEIQTVIGALVEFVLDHVKYAVRPVVNPEKAFLYRLLAALEKRKIFANAIAINIEPMRTLSGMTVRPYPQLMERWDAPGRFLLTEKQLRADADTEATSEPLLMESAHDILLTYSEVNIVGTLGSGRTSFLIQQAIDMAHARLENPRNALLPVYADLVQWQHGDSLPEFLQMTWKMPEPLMQLFNEHEVCLFVDNADSIPDGQDEDRAAALIEWLRSAQGNVRYVIASEQPLDLEAATVVELLPLSTAHMRRYIHQYADDVGSSVSQLVFTDDNLALPYLQTPFWLAAIVYVGKRDKLGSELIRNQGLILDTAVSLLYVEYNNSTGLHIPWNVLRNTLARLAFALVDGDQDAVSIEFAYQLGVTEGALRAAQKAGLLLYSDQDQIAFTYPQFKHYFAAEGLRIEGLPTRLAHPVLDESGRLVASRWEPVIIQLASTSDDPSTTIESISEVNPVLAMICIGHGIDVEDFALMQVIHRVLAFYISRGENWHSPIMDVIGSLPARMARVALLQEARSSGWQFRQAATAILRGLDEQEIPGLAQALVGVADSTQPAIASAIRQLGEKALPHLFRLLQDENWKIRQATARALGALGDKASIPALVPSLHDEHYLVARTSAEALGQLGDRHAVKWLVEALRHQDWRVREAASKALGLIGKPAVDGIMAALDDDDDDVRIYAVHALERMNDTAVLQPLIKASYDPDVEVRGAAIKALGKVEHMDAVNRLLESLSDMSVLRSGKQRIRDIAGNILRQLGFVDKAETYDVETLGDASASAADAPASEPVTDGFQSGPSAATGKERLQRIKRASRPAQPMSAEFLKDPDWRVRQAGVLAIPNHADDNIAIPILKKALQDEDNQVRVAAIRKLGNLNTENAIGGLLYALRDKDYLVADTAAAILQSIGKKAIPGLLKLLKSKNVNMRGAAVESLGKIADPIAVGPLIECLDDTARPYLSSERICDLAADALFAINTPAAIAAVQQWRQQELKSHALTNHQEFAVQSSGIDQKVKLENRENILNQLLSALREAEWEKRVDAAKALREYMRGMDGKAPEPVLKQLNDALQDDDWGVRWAVTEAVAWVADETSVPSLKMLVSDPYWMVRVSAIRALMESKTTDALDVLIEATNDENEVVRETATEALGILGNPNVIPILRKLALDDSEEFVRLAGVEALVRIDHSGILPALAKAARDENAHIRWFAMRWLASHPTDAIVPLLVTRLDDLFAPTGEEKRICDLAAEALEQLDSSEARQALENWRQASVN